MVGIPHNKEITIFNLNQLKKLYTNAPGWVKNIYAAVPYEIRSGAEYRKWDLFLKEEIDRDSYQILKLKESMLYAYEHVPYYKKTFNNLQLSPYDIHSPKDLKDFPLLTKEIVNKNFTDLQAVNYPSNKKFYVKTGGTTGHPATFFQSDNIWKKEIAFVMNFFNQFAYKPTDLKASFKGGDYENIASEKYWFYNPLNRSISFSPIHLNQSSVDSYVAQLNKYRPIFFHTYPSAILFLIHLMKEKGLTLAYDIKVIFLVSEGYDQEDIVKIQTFFKCQVKSFYGHSERILFATSSDEKLSIYTNEKRYGLMELIDDNSLQIDQINQIGKIVGTSFDNYAMPLIRYVTDDTTSYLDTEHNTIQKIDSLRNKIYLDAKGGRQISITFISISSLSDNIHSFQFYQKKEGEVELLVVPKKDFSQLDKEKILSAITNKIGHLMDVSVRIVERPMRTKVGKAINVIKEYK